MRTDLILIFCDIIIIDEVLLIYSKNEREIRVLGRKKVDFKSCFHEVINQYLDKKIVDANRKAPLFMVAVGFGDYQRTFE